MSESFDYDLLIIGAGVGGHGAALHAVSCGLKTAVVEAGVMGGTCVNRGCIPSKALLAASGKVRELRDAHHLKSLGIELAHVAFERQAIADHANGIVAKQRDALTNSLKRLGIDTIQGWARIAGIQKVAIETPAGEKVVTARDIILAPGSVPFVPPGAEIDGKTVFTSDDAVRLESLPPWIAIVGSGYIGLEFADIYSALGCEITLIEALDQLMPGFDPDIAKLAQRVLITPRDIETKVGMLAQRVIPGSPVVIELADAKTKEVVEVLEVDACLIATGRIPYTKDLGLESIGVELDRRGFIQVDDYLAVLKDGEPIPHLYAIGDATGKMMLAHAASAQGIAVVETVCGRSRTVDYHSIPAAAFTHPEIGFVGLAEPAAQEQGKAEGFEIAVARTYFKGNAKAIAEGETEGLAKIIYRKDTGEVLGVHIFGLHASDLIHEAASAIAQRQSVHDLAFLVHIFGLHASDLIHEAASAIAQRQSVHDLAFLVHTHPTLSEVLDEAYKRAVGTH